MSRATRATRQLDAAGVSYRLHAYVFDADAAGGKGVHAAQSLGIPPAHLLKTLMAWVDDRAVCVLVPSDCTLQLKKLATACHGKSARMMDITDAERRSGYKVGGISPFGQQRPVRVVMAHQADATETIFLNAGQRGLLLELPAVDARQVLQAQLADISE
ncbi:MAG TPA: aminoacyl-tRNA deacylase [Stenotrophomonas sp.]|jgi:Cys-tRNA(Pro)/Cys-tRNA(Cys) deacylase